MSTDSRGYWREELSLIALLLLFFVGIVALSYPLPFDARLFPFVIGSAGILLTLGIAIEQATRRGARDASTVDDDDPAAKADWPRYATALLTVAILALIGPYLLNVDLPHGIVGDWLIDKLALRAS